MDVECRVAAEGGHCYLDHLPLLGMRPYNTELSDHPVCCIQGQSTNLPQLHSSVLETGFSW